MRHRNFEVNYIISNRKSIVLPFSVQFCSLFLCCFSSIKNDTSFSFRHLIELYEESGGGLPLDDLEEVKIRFSVHAAA
jgi:hypothetical protein